MPVEVSLPGAGTEHHCWSMLEQAVQYSANEHYLETERGIWKVALDSMPFNQRLRGEGGGGGGKIIQARAMKGAGSLEPRPRLVTRHVPGSVMNGLSKAMRAEGVKGQNTLQHAFDVTEDSEGTDREKNQCSLVRKQHHIAISLLKH